MKKLFGTLFMLALSPLLNAEKLSEENLVMKWEEIWARNDTVNLADAIGIDFQWIRCYSDYFSKSQPNQDLERRKSELFESMRNLLARAYREEQERGVDFVKNLFLLEHKLEKAGGYNNFILSLSAARLAGSAVIVHALENPKDIEELVLVLKIRNAKTEFNTRQSMISFAKEDPKLEDHLEDYLVVLNSDKIREAHTDGFWAFYEKLLESLPEQMKSIDITDEKSVFSDPCVVKLERRQSATELYLRSTIPCLLRFMEKGGEVRRLDPYSVTVFNKVMGEERWNYGFPYTGVQNPSSTPLVEAVKKATREGSREILIKKLELIR